MVARIWLGSHGGKKVRPRRRAFTHDTFLFQYMFDARSACPRRKTCMPLRVVSSPTCAHDASVTPTGQSSVLRAHARLHERPARGAARAPHSIGRVDGVTRLQGHSATRLHLQPSARCTPRPSSIKSRRAHASVHITAKQSAPGPHRRTSGHHISGETCMTSVSGASFAVTSISCCVSFAFSLSSSSARLRAAKNLSTRASTSCCESEPTSSSS